MALGLMRDIGSIIQPVAAAPKSTAVAAGSGDATLVHGTAIDVTAITTPAGSVLTPAIEGNSRYESVDFVLTVTATVANSQGITVTASIETCAASNFSSGVTTLVSTKNIVNQTVGSGGAGTYQWIGEIGVSLENALQFIRCSYTPDLSASGTDTADMQVVAIFGGPAELP